MRILSLGAGVQSTALALMSRDGMFDLSVDAAVFADTQWEPKAVYRHLAWLVGELGEALPVYRADDTDPARVDACDTCGVYLKTVDLTRDGSAEPIADDLASLPLDLWAREQGYRRLRANLLQL